MCAAIPTLKTSQDFRRIAQTGQKRVTPAFILQLLKKDAAAVREETAGGSRASGFRPVGFRLGLTVSRKVGNAVERNRAKRRLREMVRLFLRAGGEGAGALDGCEIVLIGRRDAVSRDFARMQAEFRRALAALGVAA